MNLLKPRTAHLWLLMLFHEMQQTLGDLQTVSLVHGRPLHLQSQTGISSVSCHAALQALVWFLITLQPSFSLLLSFSFLLYILSCIMIPSHINLARSSLVLFLSHISHQTRSLCFVLSLSALVFTSPLSFIPLVNLIHLCFLPSSISLTKTLDTRIPAGPY